MAVCAIAAWACLLAVVPPQTGAAPSREATPLEEALRGRVAEYHRLIEHKRYRDAYALIHPASRTSRLTEDEWAEEIRRQRRVIAFKILSIANIEVEGSTATVFLDVEFRRKLWFVPMGKARRGSYRESWQFHEGQWWMVPGRGGFKLNPGGPATSPAPYSPLNARIGSTFAAREAG